MQINLINWSINQSINQSRNVTIHMNLSIYLAQRDVIITSLCDGNEVESGGLGRRENGYAK